MRSPLRNASVASIATLLPLFCSCATQHPHDDPRRAELRTDSLRIDREYDATGPLTLAITYRCEPAARPAFRARLRDSIAPRFAQWRDEGVCRDFEVMFNWHVDEVTYDAMILVHFAAWNDVARWQQIEAEMPGGLTAEDYAIARPLVTSSADVVWDNPGDGSARSDDSVVLLIPYVYLGLVAEYRDYVDGYVIPQLEGWLAEGTLSSYRVLLNRFPTGDRWKSYLLLEYTNLEEFGRRKHTKWKVRGVLRDDPVWSDWSARKQTIRRELEPIIAQRILPRN